MEKIKKWINIPKNSVLMGLLVTIIYFIYNLITSISYDNFYNQIYSYIVSSYLSCFASVAYLIGIIIYLITVFLRLNGKKINIKKVQKFLLISIWISIGYNLISFIDMFRFGIIYCIDSLLLIAYLLVLFIYLYGMFNKKFYINNKFFGIATLVFIIAYISYDIAPIHLYENNINWGTIIYYLILMLSKLLIIPYFYNYYNLMKGVNVDNG